MFKKILFSIFLLYSVAGFFLLPYFLKPQIVKNANNFLDAKVTLQDISFNPYILKLSLHNLKIIQDKKEVISIKELRCDIEPHQLFSATLYLKELLILGLDMHLVKDKNGAINLNSLLKPQPEQTPKEEQPSKPLNLSELPHIHIASLGVDESRIVFDDSSRKTPFHFLLKDFKALLSDFDTQKLTQSDAKFRLFTKLEDGGLIDINTALTKIENNPADGIQTQTTLKVEINRLYNEWRYIRDSMNLEIADGALTLHSNINLNTNDINATHIYDTSLAITKLRVKPKHEHKDVLNLGSLTLSNLDATPLQDKISIDAITLDALLIKASRLKDGTINWQNYLASNEKTSDTKEQKKETKKQLDFLLKNFTLKNSQILFDDKVPTPTVKIALDDMTLKMQHITLTPHQYLNYNYAMKINQSATFNADGKLSLTPLQQEGSLVLKNLALKFLNPYIAQSSYAQLQDGYLNFSTKERFAQDKTQSYSAQGAMHIDELFVKDSRDNKSLLSFNKFQLKDFSLDSKTNKLVIDNAVLDSFYVDAMVAKNKEFNLAKLSKVQPEKQKEVTPKEPTQKTRKPLEFLLKKLVVKDGSAKFADLSLPIPFKTDIHDLNGALYTLTNVAGRKTAMKLNGEIDRYGSTKIDIKTDASNPKKYTKVAMNFSNLAMNSLSGYSASFAGHKIDDGKLYLNLGYNLRDSKIKGDNSIIIKKIKIGDELKDENTTTLPLGFIVALLEDKDGIIDINMPVEGDVDAPDFKYGSFVFKTFLNLLVKAVVSPFSFLGTMMGIDAEELKSIDFEAGSVVILPPQREKLDQLTKMLIKRPKISLSIEGGYNKKVDTKILQKQKLLSEATLLTKEKKPLENESEITLVMLEKIYLNHAKKESLEKLKKEIKKEEYREKLLLKTTQLMAISQSELTLLAQKRSQEIVRFLVTKGIAKERFKTPKITQANLEDTLIPTALNLIVK